MKHLSKLFDFKRSIRPLFLASVIGLTIGCTPDARKEAKNGVNEEITATLPASVCSTAANKFNASFSTIKPLSGGNFAIDSGVLVHTIHGPGTGPTELNMKALNALPVQSTKTCGDLLKVGIYLPWCGSNRDPNTHAINDTSSWSYLRHDTLVQGKSSGRTDNVVCAASDNKKYGLIFSNNYLNQSVKSVDNFGCMYPLDGDTGNRAGRGCGVSVNPDSCIVKSISKGACAANIDAATYEADFASLLSFNGGRSASCAGSMVCSLDKSQFDVWVNARQKIDLTHTAWPMDEYVLYNWDTYSTQDIANQNTLIGIYYLTGCTAPGWAPSVQDGVAKEAQEIAALYKKWSGVDVPVVNLSNAAMHSKSTTPFSCPS